MGNKKLFPIFVFMENLLSNNFDKDTPELKYYAFDWDDNIVYMPTVILLKDEDDNEIGMSTEDFTIYRHLIGVESFTYKGKKIVGYSDRPFRYFKTEGDNQFLIDSLKAKVGPAFQDFKEAINNGSIFAIITARGHNPSTIKEAIHNYIITGFNGIDKEKLVENLRKYRSFTDEEDLSDDELIKTYLELNRYNPVSFNDGVGAEFPEIGKIIAMDEFVNYVRGLSALMNKKIYIKKGIGNKFIPKEPIIGFSDDDVKNLEAIKKHFSSKPDNIVKTYLTTGGIKKKY